jgi:predicted protein tyrosine phosphatase
MGETMAPFQLNIPLFSSIKSRILRRQFQHQPETPFPCSYWVLPGRLLAGEYAGSIGASKAIKRLPALIHAGIRVWIDLTEPDERPEYSELLHSIARNMAVRVEYHRFPICDFKAPSAQKMVEILDCIDLYLGENKPVYFHCLGGIGRTGTVAGCYLVRHGLSGEEALERIHELRARTPNKKRRSPETSAQRAMVLNWQLGR